ncbi:MAG: hypothetical protein L6M37_04515 [Candidatus Methylarchaceae archaeon HK02M1]|nr:hypothetical protein [Candidatus Methylarchaceae archaeon HK02M1]
MRKKEPNPFIPVVISILAGISWAIFILLHTIFWSIEFTLFQNIMIILVSLIIVGGLIGLMWVVWSFRAGKSSIG